MKILIYSHPPFAQTGFGRCVEQLVNHFSKTHEVYVAPIIAFAGKPTKVDNYMLLPIPGAGSELHLSYMWVKKWVEILGIELVIQHFDVWMLDECWAMDFPCPVISYAPVDCTPLPHKFFDATVGVDVNVAMSKHALKLFENEGMTATYIPHAVDPKKFFKLEKEFAREQTKIDGDFVVGMVMTNGALRKNIAGQFEAFSIFKRQNEGLDCKLYVHTLNKRVTHESYNIEKLAKIYGIEENLIYPDPFMYALGIDDKTLNLIYNSFDVLLQCSLGEGFGIPIIEAQACGVPVIGTNASAIPDVIGSGGSLVKGGTKLMFANNYGEMFIPDPYEIAGKLNLYLYDSYMDEKIMFARSNVHRFYLDHVMGEWDDLLDSIY